MSKREEKPKIVWGAKYIIQEYRHRCALTKLYGGPVGINIRGAIVKLDHALKEDYNDAENQS